MKTWNDIVKDWEKVPLEAYKFLFSQAKDRFDEVLSESQSITDKSANLAKITIAALSGFAGFNFKANPGLEWIVILSFLFLGNLICLGILMFPKSVIFKGSPPKDLLCNFLDNPVYTDDDKAAVIYFHKLVRYQERIELMGAKNSSRHTFYGIALILTVILTALTAGVIISTIFK